MKQFLIDDQVVLVTGATGYLGHQMVKDLHELNAVVIVTARSKEKAEKLAMQFDERVYGFELDISDKASVARCAQEVGEKFGHIDVLVNNAYFGSVASFEDVTADDLDDSFDGTVKAVHYCTLSFLPYLRKSKAPRIINITSMYGMVAPNKHIYSSKADTNPLTYGVGKAGIIQYTKYAAMWLAEHKITVNSISYGPFPNPQHVKDKQFLDNLANMTMLKRIGSLEDVSSAVYFLSMPASSFVTGQNIVVDGGWTAW